jgi:hypothetical protein
VNSDQAGCPILFAASSRKGWDSNRDPNPASGDVRVRFEEVAHDAAEDGGTVAVNDEDAWMTGEERAVEIRAFTAVPSYRSS